MVPFIIRFIFFILIISFLFAGTTTAVQPLTSEPDKSGISKIIDGNLLFVNGTFTNAKEKYQDLLSGQSPHTLVISCSDSRSAPETIFSSGPGELFVHRDIGNIVAPGDWNVASVLEYGIKHLNIRTIVVCGHEKCGAMKALASDGNGADVYIPGWLENSRPALVRLQSRMDKPEDKGDQDSWLTELEKENIRLQLEHLKTYPVVAESITSGDVTVYGLYWNMTSGFVEPVE